jgi:hypothetical protein
LTTAEATRLRNSRKSWSESIQNAGLDPVSPEFTQRADKHWRAFSVKSMRPLSDLPAAAFAKDINDMTQPPGALQPVLLQAKLDSIRIALLDSFKNVFVLFD